MTHHLRAEHISSEMRQCIENCSDCHDVCVETLVHCLGRGGEHAAYEHIAALLDCAQACDTSRDFMLRGSELHSAICGVCADACERCAESCEAIDADDDVMRNCAEICRRCAESCRSMAGAHARG
jgi:hypothetical protein